MTFTKTCYTTQTLILNINCKCNSLDFGFKSLRCENDEAISHVLTVFDQGISERMLTNIRTQLKLNEEYFLQN